MSKVKVITYFNTMFLKPHFTSRRSYFYWRYFINFVPNSLKALRFYKKAYNSRHFRVTASISKAVNGFEEKRGKTFYQNTDESKRVRTRHRFPDEKMKYF